MKSFAQSLPRNLGLRSGDAVLASILAGDFFGAIAGALVHLTMVWWVLEQGVSGPTVSLLVLCIFLPLNVGVLLTGVAVDRFGARKLLLASKLIATFGAVVCFALLVTDQMTLTVLGILAVAIYGAMAPSVSADISRVPAIAKLANRRLETFHAVNGIVMVTGQMLGLWAAGLLWELIGPPAAVALGVVLVSMSAVLTWIGFPRDRMGTPSPLPILVQVRESSRSVMRNLDGPGVNLSTVLVTAAIIATSQACIEVALPIAVAAAGLPASVLSWALLLAVISGIAASIIAEKTYARIRLAPALLAISMVLLVFLIISAAIADMTGFYLAVGATSGAAAAAGTFLITALQERMPVSLQAQAIGLWEFTVLSVGSLTILVTGFTGPYALIFIAILGALAVGLALRAALKAPDI